MGSTDEIATHGGLARRVVQVLKARATDVTATDVRIGLGYTAVELADDRVGVAYSFRNAARSCCSALPGAGPLAGRSARDLLSLLESSEPIEAAVGLATANALANGDATGFLEGDILDHLDIGPDDDVGMVGHFRPLVGRLRRRARSVTIFEKAGMSGADIRPAEEAPDVLPRCQVALITATAIINRTIDNLLRSGRSCRHVAILGASTPLLTEAFSETSVTMISGVLIRDGKDVLRVVSEGGGMSAFKPHVSKVSLRVDSAIQPESSGR